MITELWTVYGCTDVPDVTNFKHHEDCEVPESEVIGGVKEIEVRLHGDSSPPGAFVQVTAASTDRAWAVYRAVFKLLDPTTRAAIWAAGT